MKIKSIVGVCFILFVAMSTVFAQSGGAKAGITINESGNGKTYTVKKNQPFNVLFAKECRGCRDIWRITSIDTTLVKNVKESYSNPSCINCTGGNQDHTFQLKAGKKAGKTTLTFAYFDQAFLVNIVVK